MEVKSLLTAESVFKTLFLPYLLYFLEFFVRDSVVVSGDPPLCRNPYWHNRSEGEAISIHNQWPVFFIKLHYFKSVVYFLILAHF